MAKDSEDDDYSTDFASDDDSAGAPGASHGGAAVAGSADSGRGERGGPDGVELSDVTPVGVDSASEAAAWIAGAQLDEGDNMVWHGAAAADEAVDGTQGAAPAAALDLRMHRIAEAGTPESRSTPRVSLAGQSLARSPMSSPTAGARPTSGTVGGWDEPSELSARQQRWTHGAAPVFPADEDSEATAFFPMSPREVVQKGVNGTNGEHAAEAAARGPTSDVAGDSPASSRMNKGEPVSDVPPQRTLSPIGRRSTVSRRADAGPVGPRDAEGNGATNAIGVPAGAVADHALTPRDGKEKDAIGGGDVEGGDPGGNKAELTKRMEDESAATAAPVTTDAGVGFNTKSQRPGPVVKGESQKGGRDTFNGSSSNDDKGEEATPASIQPTGHVQLVYASDFVGRRDSDDFSDDLGVLPAPPDAESDAQSGSGIKLVDKPMRAVYDRDGDLLDIEQTSVASPGAAAARSPRTQLSLFPLPKASSTGSGADVGTTRLDRFPGESAGPAVEAVAERAESADLDGSSDRDSLSLGEPLLVEAPGEAIVPVPTMRAVTVDSDDAERAGTPGGAEDNDGTPSTFQPGTTLADWTIPAPPRARPGVTLDETVQGEAFDIWGDEKREDGPQSVGGGSTSAASQLDGPADASRPQSAQSFGEDDVPHNVILAMASPVKSTDEVRQPAFARIRSRDEIESEKTALLQAQSNERRRDDARAAAQSESQSGTVRPETLDEGAEIAEDVLAMPEAVEAVALEMAMSMTAGTTTAAEVISAAGSPEVRASAPVAIKRSVPRQPVQADSPVRPPQKPAKGARLRPSPLTRARLARAVAPSPASVAKPAGVASLPDVVEDDAGASTAATVSQSAHAEPSVTALPVQEGSSCVSGEDASGSGAVLRTDGTPIKSGLAKLMSDAATAADGAADTPTGSPKAKRRAGRAAPRRRVSVRTAREGQSPGRGPVSPKTPVSPKQSRAVESPLATSNDNAKEKVILAGWTAPAAAPQGPASVSKSSVRSRATMRSIGKSSSYRRSFRNARARERRGATGDLFRDTMSGDWAFNASLAFVEAKRFGPRRWEFLEPFTLSAARIPSMATGAEEEGTRLTAYEAYLNYRRRKRLIEKNVRANEQSERLKHGTGGKKSVNPLMIALKADLNLNCAKIYHENDPRREKMVRLALNATALSRHPDIFLSTISRWEHVADVVEINITGPEYAQLLPCLQHMKRVKVIRLIGGPPISEAERTTRERARVVTSTYLTSVLYSIRDSFSGLLEVTIANLSVHSRHFDLASPEIGFFLSSHARSLLLVDLSGNDMTDESIKIVTLELFKHITPASPLKNYRLDGNGTRMGRAACYAEWYRRFCNTSDHTLRLQREGTLLDDEYALGVTVLAQELEQLELIGCDASRLSFGFVETLNENATLRRVIFRDCKLHDADLARIVRGLANNAVLEDITIDGHNLSQQGVDEVCELLLTQPNCQIKTLSIQGGDLELSRLGVLLQVRHRFWGQAADLTSMGITSESADVIASLVRRGGMQLSTIDLSYNDLGNESALLIIDALRHIAKFGKLRDVDFEATNIDDGVAEELAKLIRESRTLRGVNLSNNALTAAGARLLQNAGYDRPPDWTSDEHSGIAFGGTGVLTAMGMVQRHKRRKREQRTGPRVYVELDGNDDGALDAELDLVVTQTAQRAMPIAPPQISTVEMCSSGLAPDTGGVLQAKAFAASLLLPPGRSLAVDAAAGGDKRPKFKLGRKGRGAGNVVHVSMGRVDDDDLKHLPALPKATSAIGLVIHCHHSGSSDVLSLDPDEDESRTPVLAMFHGLTLEPQGKKEYPPQALQVLFFPGYRDSIRPGDVFRWTVVPRSSLRLRGDRVLVHAPLAGYYRLAWDWSKCPVPLQRVHVLMFVPAYGWATDEGSFPVYAFLAPVAAPEADTLGLFHRVERVMREAPRAMRFAGAGTALVRMGRAVRIAVQTSSSGSDDNEVASRIARWTGRPRFAPPLRVVRTASLNNLQRLSVHIHTVETMALNETSQLIPVRKRVCGMEIQLPIVDRKPDPPTNFYLIDRTEDRALFHVETPSVFMERNGPEQLRLYMKKMRLGAYAGTMDASRIPFVHVQHKRDGDTIQLNGGFYAAVFAVTSANKYGESKPSRKVTVHPGYRTKTEKDLEAAAEEAARKAGEAAAAEDSPSSATFPGTPLGASTFEMFGSSGAVISEDEGGGDSEVQVTSASTLVPSKQQGRQPTDVTFMVLPVPQRVAEVRYTHGGTRLSLPYASLGFVLPDGPDDRPVVAAALMLAQPDVPMRKRKSTVGAAVPLLEGGTAEERAALTTLATFFRSVEDRRRATEKPAPSAAVASGEKPRDRRASTTSILSREEAETDASNVLTGYLRPLPPPVFAAGSVHDRTFDPVRGDKSGERRGGAAARGLAATRAASFRRGKSMRIGKAANAQSQHLSNAYSSMPGMLHESPETVGGKSMAMLHQENGKLLVEALNVAFEPVEFESAFGVGITGCYSMLRTTYPHSLAVRPFAVLLQILVSRIRQAASSARSNTSNCKQLSDLFVAGSRNLHEAFLAHYRESLPVLRALLMLGMRMLRFLAEFSSERWLRHATVDAGACAAQFAEMDSQVVEAFSLCPFPSMIPVVAGMSLPREYTDERLVRDLTFAFVRLTSEVIPSAGAAKDRPRPRVVREVCKQLEVPDSSQLQRQVSRALEYYIKRAKRSMRRKGMKAPAEPTTLLRRMANDVGIAALEEEHKRRAAETKQRLAQRYAKKHGVAVHGGAGGRATKGRTQQRRPR